MTSRFMTGNKHDQAVAHRVDHVHGFAIDLRVRKEGDKVVPRIRAPIGQNLGEVFPKVHCGGGHRFLRSHTWALELRIFGGEDLVRRLEDERFVFLGPQEAAR